MRAKVQFGTPEKARVKFPHSLILHFAFSSWIEKIMTKTSSVVLKSGHSNTDKKKKKWFHPKRKRTPSNRP